MFVIYAHPSCLGYAYYLRQELLEVGYNVPVVPYTAKITDLRNEFASDRHVLIIGAHEAANDLVLERARNGVIRAMSRDAFIAGLLCDDNKLDAPAPHSPNSNDYNKQYECQ